MQEPRVVESSIVRACRMQYLVICWGQFLTRRWLSTWQAGICTVITVTVTKAQSEKQAAENQHHQVTGNLLSCQLNHTVLSEILLFIIDL